MLLLGETRLDQGLHSLNTLSALFCSKHLGFWIAFVLCLIVA
jgi:hypothetical protein